MRDRLSHPHRLGDGIYMYKDKIIYVHSVEGKIKSGIKLGEDQICVYMYTCS